MSDLNLRVTFRMSYRSNLSKLTDFGNYDNGIGPVTMVMI